MRPDPRDLYQEVILDHNKRPRNRRPLPEATHHAEGFNPLCGDKVEIFLRMEGDVVQEATFLGSGCAISTSSVSLLTEAIRGKRLAEIDRLRASFLAEVTGSGTNGTGDLGKLVALTGVKEYPSRVKCAVLAWHTLKAALERRRETVTTEAG